MDLTRRRLLGALGTGPVALAGCCAPPDYEVYIRPTRDTRITAGDGEWVIDGTVRAMFYLGSERTVEDVRVVVFDENGDRRLGHELGDIDGSAATDTGERCGGRRLDVPLELTTAAFPYRIELQTPADVACEDDVEVSSVEFIEESDTGQAGTLGESWRYEDVQCRETPTGTERVSQTETDRGTPRTGTDS